MITFDEEAARRVERTYATPDVVAQRAEVLRLLALRPGERVLDIGSGPGYLAASMADAVGTTGTVVGIDTAEAMNALARARCGDRVMITEGDATALAAPDASYDAAVSTQVYEYVADLPAALAELRRVLRPGGRVLILDTDWDSVVWNVADRTRHQGVMAAWEDHLVDPRLPRTLAPLLSDAGFDVLDRRVIPLFNPDYDPDTYSASVSSMVATFVAGRGGVTAEDADAWQADVAADPYFFSINRYAFLAVRP